MYNINHDQNEYCLLYYVHDNSIYFNEYDIFTHQIIPYCLQLSDQNIFERILNVINEPHFTFVDLRKRNISSQQLLSWSATIDQAEEYEIFLNSILSSSWTSYNEVYFYNCTSPWFGPQCRFAFDFPMNYSFDDIVISTFKSKSRVNRDTKVPCYEHLDCKALFKCLDWREICDRKIDCIDGSDELDCWQLEINECAENEYRCYNGQCVPQEVLHDNPFNPDCLDQTDESAYTSFGGTSCSDDPSFRCEECACRPGQAEFPCGDGQCTRKMQSDCMNGRENIFLDDVCSIAIACLLKLTGQFSICGKLGTTRCEEFCKETICGHDNCSALYEFPSYPVFYGHVRFLFMNRPRSINIFQIVLPDYICYDESLCADFLPVKERLNGLTCRYFTELGLELKDSFHTLDSLSEVVKNRFRPCSTTFNQIQSYNNLTMYRCLNSSKVISKHRLVDGMQDCPYNDDETFKQSCSLNDIQYRYKCSVNGIEKCFALLIIDDGKIDCDNRKDEYDMNTGLVYLSDIYFPTICDGIDHLLPILIDGNNETDETNCEHWECNNTYTRCDGFWSCKNGADEIGCSKSICVGFEHKCVFFNDTTRVSCLPIDRAGDGVIDCVGATDERHPCQLVDYYAFEYGFQCWNSTRCIDSNRLCDHLNQCRLGDDEGFCSTPKYLICSANDVLLTEVEDFLCKFAQFTSYSQDLYFLLHNMPSYPQQLNNHSNSEPLVMERKTELLLRNKIIHMDFIDVWRCNRGISIRIRMNDSASTLFCLCPPSYYGDRCQYQNQRVSLTVQIRATSDWRNIFILFITLVDNEGKIESHDIIEYLPIRDCDSKFNVYLLYATKPKNASKNYSVQIDVIHQLTLRYRASWIFPLRFSFLPVHRLSVLLIIPHLHMEATQNCSLPCLHGQCFNYINDRNSRFCRCSPGWSGIQCNIKHTCNCASNSLCVSNYTCLCPLNRYGSRCYLIRHSCYPEYCFNDGQCVANNDRGKSIYWNQPVCVCPKEYSGDRCERRQTRIDISFDKKLTIPPSLLIHLITVREEANPARISIMKKVPFDQNSVVFFTSTIFNIAVVEFSKFYYLIILQEQHISSIDLSTKIIPSYRCLSIDELFNETVTHQHLLKRIKLYHIPCQKRSELVCFHDMDNLCFCDLHRRANCFRFDHNKTYDCRGYNFCENDGHCFEDDSKCPTSSMCVCSPCYYGSRCQFSTKGLTLSLDIILGYRIQPNLKINQQSTIVQISIVFTTMILVFGWFSNVFLYLTFRKEGTRNVGCCLYLFALSITSLATVSIFTIKFWLLLTSQVGLVNNRLFLNTQCASTDFILRILLSTGDWFNACVAIERVLNVSKGINFDKIKSRIIAKWMIVFIYLLTLCTHVHDPIYRYVIDDEEEKRTWCVTKYSPFIQIYDSIVNIFHFSIPFSINCISGLIIIMIAARTRSNVDKRQSYQNIFRKQLSYHKHLLISSFILVSCAVPRLIISLLSACMKSSRDSWFYLIGYFVSFIPAMLTFVTYILPSKMYQKQFMDSMKHFFKRR